MIEKYPWILDQALAEREGLTIDLLYKDGYRLYFDALSYIKRMFTVKDQRKGGGWEFTFPRGRENLEFYSILCVLARIMPKPNRERLAVIYSKHQARLLTRVPEKMLMDICNAVDIPARHKKRKIVVPVQNYIAAAARIKDPYYRLVNQHLKGGLVYISRQHLIRLIEAHIYDRVRRDPTKNELDMLEKTIFQDAFLAAGWEAFTEMLVQPVPRKPSPVVQSGIMPPCVVGIILKRDQGINLSHSERVFVASFYNKIGKSVEETVEFFSRMPDHDAARTIKYVADIYKKGYVPANCGKLRSYNICVADCGIANPLQYRPSPQ